MIDTILDCNWGAMEVMVLLEEICRLVFCCCLKQDNKYRIPVFQGDASSADTIPISIPSKFLLSESSSSLNEELPAVGVGVDPETQARLEAILNATGLSKFSLEAKQVAYSSVLFTDHFFFPK